MRKYSSGTVSDLRNKDDNILTKKMIRSISLLDIKSVDMIHKQI